MNNQSFKDITGKTHGRLTALAPVGKHHKTGRQMWLCSCECGGQTKVQVQHLGGKIGIRSCGCLLLEAARSRPVRNSTNLTHGESGTKGAKRSSEYTIWASMRQRCQDKNHDNYSLYGGRGISVCAEWEVFATFLADMGRRPTRAMTLDRIDVNGNYEPGNCRWATWKTQQNNRRDVKFAIVNGTQLKVTEISEKFSLSQKTVHNWVNRVGNGGDISEMLVRHRPLSRPRVGQRAGV